VRPRKYNVSVVTAGWFVFWVRTCVRAVRMPLRGGIVFGPVGLLEVLPVLGGCALLIQLHRGVIL